MKQEREKDEKLDEELSLYDLKDWPSVHSSMTTLWLVVITFGMWIRL